MRMFLTFEGQATANPRVHADISESGVCCECTCGAQLAAGSGAGKTSLTGPRLLAPSDSVCTVNSCWAGIFGRPACGGCCCEAAFHQRQRCGGWRDLPRAEGPSPVIVRAAAAPGPAPRGGHALFADAPCSCCAAVPVGAVIRSSLQHAR